MGDQKPQRSTLGYEQELFVAFAKGTQFVLATMLECMLNPDDEKRIAVSGTALNWLQECDYIIKGRPLGQLVAMEDFLAWEQEGDG